MRSDPLSGIDPMRHPLPTDRTDARRLGLPWYFVTRTKAKLKAGTLPLNGAAVRRRKGALINAAVAF